MSVRCPFGIRSVSIRCPFGVRSVSVRCPFGVRPGDFINDKIEDTRKTSVLYWRSRCLQPNGQYNIEKLIIIAAVHKCSNISLFQTEINNE